MYARKDDMENCDEVKNCKELLQQVLADGQWHDVEEIRALVKSLRIRKSDFKQARKELGVETMSNGDGMWSWRLRDEREGA